MLEFFKKWLQPKEERPAPRAIGERRRTPRPEAAHKPKGPQQQPEADNLDPHVAGRIESVGPGKNVLIRNKYQHEDTGTHDTLKILDDSAVDSGEEDGLDPYNTGKFDRSKNWDKRFRN